MVNKVTPLVMTLLMAASVASPASAGLIFPTATGVTQSQLSLVVTTLTNGDLLYTTTDQVTNNNAFTVSGIYEVVTARNINGSAAQWDNADQLWALGGCLSIAPRLTANLYRSR